MVLDAKACKTCNSWYVVRVLITVGRPISVEKVDNPSDEQILKLHSMYLERLQELYEKYKDIHHKDRIRDLKFVK